MSRRIFISYRREDGAASARSICDRLSQHFGSENVFMDVESMRPGQRFDLELDRALSQCAAFIALIGPRWMELLEKRQLEGTHDFVRQELATALERKMVVIPVLVEGARLPPSTVLPADISAVAFHQKQDISHERFSHDIGDLVAALEIATGKGGWSKWRYGAAVAGVLVLGVALSGAYMMGRRVPTPPQPPAAVKRCPEPQRPHSSVFNLRESFRPDPSRHDVTAGGDVDLAACFGGTAKGWVTRQPDFVVMYRTLKDGPSAETLTFRTDSVADTILLINDPNGQWHFNDDGGGGKNAKISFPRAAKGRYDVWIGTFSKGNAQAKLLVTELE